MRIYRPLLTLVIATSIALMPHCLIADHAARLEVKDCVVRFAQEVEVPALHSAPIAELKVQVNELVSTGQALARQDDTYLLLQRRTASWQHQAAHEEAADQLDLEYAKALYDEAVAQRDADRGIYQKGGSSLRAVRQSELAVQRAQLEIRRAEKQHRLALMDVEMRAAEMAAVDEKLKRLSITSPIAGVVVKRDKNVGEWSHEGETVATIARLDRLQVDALLHGDQLPAQSATGCKVFVSWTKDGKSQQLTGTIESVDRQILSGGLYRLHAMIDNQRDGHSWRLWPGTSVTMTVQPPTSLDSNNAATRGRPQ